MKRKVMLHGPSTLTVSLPSVWVKKNKIKKGQELDVVDLGRVLHVSSDENGKENVYSADISDLSACLVKRILAILHKNGYDKITLRCKPEQISIIQSRINSMLIGYEIVALTSTSCTIKAISTPTQDEFDSLFRRIFLVTLSLSEGMCSLVEEKKFASLEELLALEETNNKLTNYIERLINKQFLIKEKQSYLYLLAWLEESIADDYKELCHLLRTEKSLSKSFLSLFKEVHALHYAFYELFYNFSFASVEKIQKQKEQLDKRFATVFQDKLTKREIQILFSLSSVKQRIWNSLGSIIAYHN